MNTEQRLALHDEMDGIEMEVTDVSKLYTVGELRTVLESYPPEAKVGVFTFGGGGEQLDFLYYEETNKIAIVAAET